MPAATASWTSAASSEAGRRSTTARSVTANLPPSRAAVRSSCAAPADTEPSRSVSTAASEAGSRSPAAETSGAGACSQHRRHQARHVGFCQRAQRDDRAPVADGGRAKLLYLGPARRRPARPDQQQPKLADGGGELMPDDQRRVVGPLQVIEDDDGGGGCAGLIHPAHPHPEA